MYKAIGSNEGQWRDGVFSLAAPLQDYQASLSEFADGSLGFSSLSRPRPSLRGRQRPKAYKRGVSGEEDLFDDGSDDCECDCALDDGTLGATSSLTHPMAALRARKLRRRRLALPPRGAGGSSQTAAWQSGMLHGNTFLPAFTAQQMRGLGHAGHAFRDGSLGADPLTTIAGDACTAIGPCVDNFISKRMGKGEALDESLKVPFNQLAAVAIVGIAVYLYFKR